MRLIKLFFFVFLLSSCNKYIGTVDVDYSPTNELVEVFSSNINTAKIDSLIFENIKYPKNKKKITNANIKKIEKVTSLSDNSSVYINKHNIYVFNKKSLIVLSKSNYKNKLDFKIVLDNKENVIRIFENKGYIYVLTDRAKLFKLNDGNLNLEYDLDIFINPKTILLEEELILFSVFGDILEFNISKKNTINRGKIDIINHGISSLSYSYNLSDHRSYLFNSGTPIFLNKKNNELNTNYILEDLNILSSMNEFQDFIDAPFEFQNYLYFIEKKGYVSVFKPSDSDILWEMDINSTILDYSFSKKGHLALLTANKILIIDKNGSMNFEYFHNIDEPMSFIIRSNKFHIFNKKGINVFDINENEAINYIETKFNDFFYIIDNDTDLYVRDSKSLFKISE